MKILTTFHLGDLDCPEGATLVIKPLSKQSAAQMARARGAEPTFANELPRQMDRITEALGLPFIPANQIKIGETVIVAEAMQWNNIRFYQVEFMATANGEMPEPPAKAEPDPFEE